MHQSVWRVCVCVCVSGGERRGLGCECGYSEEERERGRQRGAGLSSCALSIIHDLTLGKTEEGKVDSSDG